MSSDQPERKMVGSPRADSGIDPIVEPCRTRAPTYHRIGTRPIEGRRRIDLHAEANAMARCTPIGSRRHPMMGRSPWRPTRARRRPDDARLACTCDPPRSASWSEATRRVGLDDPLDGPGDKQPPGDKAGDAPEPRDAHGDIVALCFISHLRRSCSASGLRLSAERSSPSPTRVYSRTARAKPARAVWSPDDS